MNKQTAGIIGWIIVITLGVIAVVVAWPLILGIGVLWLASYKPDSKISQWIAYIGFMVLKGDAQRKR